MNLRDPKTQIVAVIVILFLGLYYLWFAKLYTPFQAQIVAKEVQKGNLLTQLHKVEERAATLTELQKEYGDLLVKYKKVEVLLPERKEDEALLNQIHAAAQLTQSIIIEITPLGTIPSEFFEVEATYHGLGKFLARIANFPFIVNLNDITLKSPAQNLGMMQPETLKDEKPVIATFKVSTYNVKQGQGS
jgi:Tfp pilus assembly protein PilO